MVTLKRCQIRATDSDSLGPDHHLAACRDRIGHTRFSHFSGTDKLGRFHG
jgi:hypothetical protein